MTDVDGWGHQAAPPGPGGEIVAAIRRLQRDVAALQTRAPLRAASISEGGLVIKDGGRIRILDGGGLSAYRPDGTHAVSLGPIYDASNGGALTWYGLLVEDTAGEEALAVLTRIDTGISSIQAAPSGSFLVAAGGQVDIAAAQQLYLHATGTGENAFLYAEGGGGAFLRATSGTGPVAITSAGGSATVQGGTSVGITAGTDMFLDAADSVVVDADESVFIEAGAAGASGSVQLKIPQTAAATTRRVEFTDADGLIADFDSGGMHLYAAPAGTGNALVLNSGNGRVQTVSSSRRYKEDIEDHQVDLDAILQLRGRSWRDRAEAAENPGTTNRYAGLIAEEVHDLGLTEAVLYDPDGAPRNIQDRPLIVGLIQLAQRQQAQIDALTARLDALDGGAPAAQAARTASTAVALATHSGDVIAIPESAEPAVPTPRPQRPTPPLIPDPQPEPQEA